jgi:hypothetical protein
MKKLTLFYLVITGFCFPVLAQSKFFKVYTNNGYDYGQGITQLADSSYMVTGSSSSFNTSSSQAFLLKLDKFGSQVWTKNFGGNDADWSRRVLNWNDSIFYCVGHSVSPTSGWYTNYLIQTDKNGNELVSRHYDHAGWDKMNDAILTVDTTLFLVGETTATATTNRNFYMMKLNKQGDTLWTRNFGSPGEDAIHAILPYNDTTFFAVGYQYNVDSLVQKAAVIKFYTNGSIAWVKEFGNHGSYALNDFYIRANQIFAVGSRTNPLAGDLDEYRLIVDTAGNFIWEESTQGNGDVFYEVVSQYGNNGKVYIGSYRQNNFSANGTIDAEINRFYDNLVWENSFVTVAFLQEDRVTQIIPTSDGGAIAVGYLTVEGFGGSSVFVLKIGANDDYPIVNLASVNSLVTIQELAEPENTNLVVFPNPTSGKVTLNHSSNASLFVEINNTFGQTVWHSDVFSGETIDATDWKIGVYFMNIYLPDGSSQRRKLIVHK